MELSSGALFFNQDNTTNIGAPGTLRPATIFAATTIQADVLGTATSGTNFGSAALKTVGSFWNPSAFSGVVSTSGTAVSWVSGSVFVASMVGGTIVINGTNYTVATFVSNHSIAVSSSAGTQSNVAYSFAAAVNDIWSMTNVLGAGSTPSSTLTITHSGSSTPGTIDLEGVATSNSSSGASGTFLDITVNGTAYKIQLNSV